MPSLRTVWAVRVPLLLMAALFLLSLTPRLSPAIATTMFLVEGGRGIFVVGLLASLAASVAMVTLRIVLLYGERIGLGRPRWQSAARWSEVLVFQGLAVPVTLACIHQTALDRSAAGQSTAWSAAWDLAPPGWPAWSRVSRAC